MILYRKNNYYRIHGTSNTFSVDIDPVSRKPKTYCEEIILNCQEIYESCDLPIYCMYSGGIDSEFLMEIFVSQGMKVTPVIVKMKSEFNDHDINWAFDFCSKKNIKPIIYDLDIDKFIKSGEILELATKYKTSQYQNIPIIKAALSIDGFVINGQDEPYLGLNQTDNKWYYYEKEKWCAWPNLYNSGEVAGTSLLSRSSESFAAFLLDPTIKELCNNKIPGKLGSRSSKKLVYGRMFPMPERTKYTGWEKIGKTELYYHEYVNEVRKLDEIYGGVFKIEYNQLLQTICPDC